MSSPDGSTVTFRRTLADVRPRAVTAFARKLEREVARGRAFDTLISGDAELRRLNRQFRGQDHATDVLSFPAATHGTRASNTKHGRASLAWTGWESYPAGTVWEGRPRRLGDLAISAGRARAQARVFGHTIEQEVRILMLHGLLHLLGMDHESDGGRMARAEQRWRRQLGLPNGLIERVRS